MMMKEKKKNIMKGESAFPLSFQATHRVLQLSYDEWNFFASTVFSVTLEKNINFFRPIEMFLRIIFHFLKVFDKV